MERKMSNDILVTYHFNTKSSKIKVDKLNSCYNFARHYSLMHNYNKNSGIMNVTATIIAHKNPIS